MTRKPLETILEPKLFFDGKSTVKTGLMDRISTAAFLENLYVRPKPGPARGLFDDVGPGSDSLAIGTRGAVGRFIDELGGLAMGNMDRDHVVDPFADVSHQFQVQVVVPADLESTLGAGDFRHDRIFRQSVNGR